MKMHGQNHVKFPHINDAAGQNHIKQRAFVGILFPHIYFILFYFISTYFYFHIFLFYFHIFLFPHYFILFYFILFPHNFILFHFHILMTMHGQNHIKFPHINDDARSKSHQIKGFCSDF